MEVNLYLGLQSFKILQVQSNKLVNARKTEKENGGSKEKGKEQFK